MPRKKPEPNVWQRFGESMDSTLAETVIFGEHDVLASVVVPGQAVDGSLIFGGYEQELVTDPRIERWIEALRDFDKRGDKAPLIELLQFDVELLPILHRSLTDLLFRHRLIKKPDTSRATPYERQVLALLDELEELRKLKRLHGKHASEIRRELDDLVSRRKLLARMVQRYEFVRRRGAQFAPTYTMTTEDAMWHARYAVADEEVRSYIGQGYSASHAVEKVAAEYFPQDVGEKLDNLKTEAEALTAERAEFAAGLENYHARPHASSRNKERRRK